MRCSIRLWSAVLVLLVLGLGTPFAHVPAQAQGRDQYLNLLAPPIKPLTVIGVGGSPVILVCNTPASRLEIWEPSGAGLTFVDSVPTGLKPVSVAAKPSLEADGSQTIYTANWLGDSITAIRLKRGTGGLRANLLRTVFAGDEPTHIAFFPPYPAGHPMASLAGPGAPYAEHLVVTFGQAARWGTFHPTTLLASIGGAGAIDLKATVPGGTWAAKAPRHVAFVPAGASQNTAFRQIVLNFRGGQTPGPTDRAPLDATPFDFDLWMTDNPSQSFVSGGLGTSVSNLGTNNFNMTIAPNGDIYVVGQKARNLSVPATNEPLGVVITPTPTGEALHRGQAITGTGFVRSMIWRIRNAGTAAQVIEARDLNESLGAPGTPVGYANAVSQPTDVVVYGSGDAGSQVIVTGFASDSIGVLNVTGASLATFTVTPVAINPSPFQPPNNLGNRPKGPRGLAIQLTGNPATDRLLIYNWLDNTLGTIPISQLGAQPVVYSSMLEVRPNQVLDGQGFLFASTLSRQNTVSCGSCHPDGDADWLDWNLSDGVDLTAAGPNAPGVLISNSGRKGPMVTQSLRGLVNFEVADKGLQAYISNQPYHWRGDRGDFTQFNGAFDNLMAIPSPFVAGEEGIPGADMNRYRDFVDSIHYPPNPEQPLDRRYSGSFCSTDCTTLTAAQLDTEADNQLIGTQAALGLKLFHSKAYESSSTSFLTCVSCHLLPEGSDNRLSDDFGFWAGPSHGSVRDQFIETAALRFGIAKEKRLFRFDRFSGVFVNDGAITANSGLGHTGADTATVSSVPIVGPLLLPTTTTPLFPGASESLFDFMRSVFSVTAGRTFSDNNFPNDEVSATALYLRQFDTGVGPAVGLPFSVDPALWTGQPATVNAVLNVLEASVLEVDAGLVVQIDERGGGRRGYRFDAAAFQYVEVSGAPATGNLSRAALLNRLTAPTAANDVFVFQNVPLGSERRLADLSNTFTGTLPIGPTPPGANLVGMEPNTANELVAFMDTNWRAVVASAANRNRATGFFQQALLTDAATATPPGFGLSRVQFDAPRRFRIRVGNPAGVAYGAKLRLTVPLVADLAVIPPVAAPNPATHTTYTYDLHAGLDAGGAYWETVTELDPDVYLALMNGVFTDANTYSKFNNVSLLPPDPFTFYTAGFLNPMGTNWYWVEIDNNGSIGPGSWQNITLKAYP